MTNSKLFSVRNSNGQHISVRLDLPADGVPIATAILAHTFPKAGTPEVDRVLSSELTRYGLGVAVLNVEEPTVDGKERKSDAEIADDLLSIMKYLAAQISEPGLLIGHSHACRAVLKAAETAQKPPDVALVGADFGEGTTPRFAARGQALLIVHDPTGGPAESNRMDSFFENADHPKAFIPIIATDPWESDSEAAAYPAAMLGNWARFNIGTRQEKVKHREEHDNCTVAVTRRDRFRTEVLTSGHSIVADEPIELNGTNTGPNPYGLLLASLAACTTITMRMYADRKEWPMESVHVRMTHERVHAEDCNCDADDRTGLLDVIRKYVTLEGDLTEAQRSRLMQIADLCPVHKTLKNQPVIETTLQGEEAVLECR